MEFGGLLETVDRLDARGRFLPGQAAATRVAIQQSQTLTESCQIAPAMAQLQQLRQRILSGQVVQALYQDDLEIPVSKLARRLALLSRSLIVLNPPVQCR
jgi:hypothetical protein